MSQSLLPLLHAQDFKILVVLPFLYWGQNPVDTAQVVIADRYNSKEAINKPYVILVSTDGYRYDYTDKYNALHLKNLAKSGVSATAMLPSFPSITFPNHWSLVTGLYPAHHGLVDNYFYDYSRKQFYAMSKPENAEDGSWYGGIPLWSLAEKQGVLSASLQWVGSASDAGGARPSYYYHYHEKFSPEDKIQKVVDWLKLPENIRPHLITLYFPEVDAAGHHFGPDSKETQQAVQMVDAAVGKLNDEVKKLGLKNVNFVFVSDHGMIKVDSQQPLEIPQILMDKNRFDYFNAQTLLRVVVKNPEETLAVYRELKKNSSSDYKVILSKRFPRKLHYGVKDDTYKRIGQIILVPKAPKIFLEKDRKTSVGKHGYNPKTTPEMKAVFYAWGPEFKENYEIKEFQNVNIYPLIADILGLKITHPIDGNLKVLQKVLRK